MKLYLVSQNINNEYDTFDAIVVAAESIEDAKTIHPHGGHLYDYNERSWVHSVDDLEVMEIGEANPDQQRGVILASFNAG